MNATSFIEVVGAGPAGLAAAITAARGGARVVVHERAPRVGARFHGDFQGLEGRIGLVLRAPRPFGGIGNVGLPRTAIAGDTLLAGEAAGFQDPLWGFGIRHAILSGHLAPGRCSPAGRGTTTGSGGAGSPAPSAPASSTAGFTGGSETAATT